MSFFLMALASPGLCQAATVGESVDVVPFGQLLRSAEEGGILGVFWEDARDIRRVVVTLADADQIPVLDHMRIEYWQSSWPDSRIPRDAPSGAGTSGWLNVGDWFQGEWRAADTDVAVEGATFTFTFRPLDAKEFPRHKGFSATYRTTLKIRLIADGELPRIKSLAAYTDAVWQPLEFEVEWRGADGSAPQVWDGHLEVFNGVIDGVMQLGSDSDLQIDRAGCWTSTVRGGGTDGIRARILCTKPVAWNSFDATVVTVRAGRNTFSFAADDLIEHGHIFVPDFGAIVRRSGVTTTYAAAALACRADREKSIYHRVAQMPEQTLARAWADTPKKGRFYIPLSFEGGRQHFGLEPDGSLFCDWHWLSRIPGKDTRQCLYDGNTIRYHFGLADAQVTDRHPLDGHLPIMVTQWQRDGVRYRQTALVIPFDSVPRNGARIEADDPLVLMARFEMEPVANAPGTARLDLQVVAAQPEELKLEDDLILAPGKEGSRLRMRISSPDLPDSYRWTAEGTQVVYRSELTAAAPRRIVDVAIPYITLTEAGQWDQLRSLRFAPALAAVRDYWRRRVQAGTQIVTPEPMINDFYKAHVSHLLINTEREVGADDRYMAKVGTFRYGVYSNESCMMVSDLDRRGYRQRAEESLNTWLHYQGTVGLPGDFSTKEGEFYGAGGYEAGGYNQHHGFVLWCLGEHYWYTRDDEWLKRVAPKIIKACDWIVGERKRMTEVAGRSPLRAIERGLLPPGYLEDIRDWRSWLSTNVYSWWGMHNAAAALDAADIPAAARLLDEAEAYRRDILAAFTEAMRRSPVVRLRDGRWIPHVPPDVHRRGRTFGWITETLEGAIHMIRCGMIEPRSRLATWIIEDYEDNLYLSSQYGYDLTGPEFEKYWFSRGGISMQANLLCNPIPYLLRDEPQHFLRAYFNAFAVSYFSDTRMMTEHALPNIGDWRGDHYKSSDEANSTYWLRLMFVQERGHDLWLGAAIPRYWLADGNVIGIENSRTTFGPMSARWESRVADGWIEMILDPPRRNPPQRLVARFRHPEQRPMIRCEVDGKPYDRFDAEREWIELEDCRQPTRIRAYYQ